MDFGFSWGGEGKKRRSDQILWGKNVLFLRAECAGVCMCVFKGNKTVTYLDMIANHARTVKLNWRSWDLCNSVKQMLLLHFCKEWANSKSSLAPTSSTISWFSKESMWGWRGGGVERGSPARNMTLTNECKMLEQHSQQYEKHVGISGRKTNGRGHGQCS